MGDKVSPVEIAKMGVDKAKRENFDVVIIDTAGRLSIDEALMEELVNIETEVHPSETLLLVDAMSGQDAVNVARTFNEKLKLTGIVMSKLDGDARGGSALSIKHLTGVPIKYAGVGEKLDDLEIFHPDRMADRILGMGDVVTLVEKVQEEVDEKQAKKAVNKMMSGKFDLEDMLAQLEQFNKLGSMGGLLKLIPGMPKITDEQQEQAQKELKKTKAIIYSMTPRERKDPSIIKNSRKIRIAQGCGMTSYDVNRVLNKFEQMKEMMKRMKSGKFGKGGFPGGMGGLGL
jgi:signal recognition particle subunit SRP54